MKKTISINISGILFHIEEDGYDNLKKYLEAINKHFSHYEDNQEIIKDIENRIAEIFLSNLKNNKQVISAENVDKLIEKMGTIADFKAVEEEKEPDAKLHHEEENENGDSEFYKYITPPNQEAGKGYKKLTRLERSKILGGVCAGLAHYLAIDPLWTRLVAILLLFSGEFSLRNFDFFPWDWNISLSLGWWAVLAYIVLWVILPVSYDEPEDKQIKKLYRNPDDRVIGGVSSGLAAYFNIEVLWARLAFVGLIFAGGAGFVIYLILWIITPLAKSITERIKMKGGEITLSNIESTIIENRQIPEMPQPKQHQKAWLAPFRFLGNIINELGKALGPLGKFIIDVIRVAFGLIIFFIGLVITLTPLAFLGAYFEFFTNDSFKYMIDNIPVEMLSELLPVWLALAASVTVLIPGIVITLLGISVLIRRSLIDSRFGLVTFGIWLLSIMVCAFQIPKTIAQFKNEGTYTKESVIDIPDSIVVIEATKRESEFNELGLVHVELKGTEDSTLMLEQKFQSQGRSLDDAVNNAKSIQYEYMVVDSVISFNRSLEFSSMAKFRGQNLRQTLYIPYNKPFVMDKSLLSIIRNTIYSNGYKLKDVTSNNYWVFNEDGLLCLTCTSEHKTSEADSLSRVQFKDQVFMKE
ncbi:PspC domain-containing protein [Echinicola sp. CAU 1574]|uniref:PspC domain-containing protein n=1 Tax=Echinicola arenosa TaxID=2774144 RepID=A0ABR9AIH8_9BACT|nr:PspC domain-containing protein [Echinicola arenosa]MBD8488117.1 PspC domain-containing protein [Echinicola arenosa]